jgi:aryl-alcohol dehydrogenase-like predicted oxidoreductase
MISGFATPDATQQLAGDFSDCSYNLLKRTGLWISSVGFGCYRVNAGVAAHYKALEKALRDGINVVDTSANYADGGSEKLVGQVIGSLIDDGSLTRSQVVVISKGGYLQGRNLARYRQRVDAGRPFLDVVNLKDGLAHCIHPEFLDDQIGRSLDRLGMETIDGYLLHNPEYYLEWAHRRGDSIAAAREEYYRRIEQAFRYFETEVVRGRIRFYGISSNTFPARAGDPEFTELQRIGDIAESLGPNHHFHVIQLPLNLLETGAILEKNQPDGKSVLDLAREKKLGVLTNRPLNAFTSKRMVRLAGIDVRERMDYQAIIGCIKDLAQSETRLWRKILPDVASIPGGIRIRIKQQGCFAETLKHHWRSFGSYERWREAKDGIFIPRIQGVIDYLGPHAENQPELADWIQNHEKTLNRAFRAVASIYADEAIALERKIVKSVDQADADWAISGSLSQKAIGALTSTAGISTVLVGMRKKSYVSDAIAAGHRSVIKQERTASWQRLSEMYRDIFLD